MLKPSRRGTPTDRGAAAPLAGLVRLVGLVRGALALVVREVLKFGVVGGVAFVVDVGLFNLLVHAGDDPVLGTRPVTGAIVSTGVAIVVAWLGNRYWTFRHRRRSAVAREVLLFFAINLVGLGIAAGCLAVSRYVLGFDSQLADNVAKNGVGLVLGMVFRFLCYRYLVFRGDLEQRRAAGPPPAPPAPDAAPRSEPAPAQRTWTTSPALSDTRP
ncbi:MAG: GtrA family protein [Kineosporiaceae bacterium]